jgi:hypothetical protein
MIGPFEPLHDARCAPNVECRVTIGPHERPCRMQAEVTQTVNSLEAVQSASLSGRRSPLGGGRHLKRPHEIECQYAQQLPGTVRGVAHRAHGIESESVLELPIPIYLIMGTPSAHEATAPGRSAAYS